MNQLAEFQIAHRNCSIEIDYSKNEMAIEAYKEIIRLNPNIAYAYYYLGQSYGPSLLSEAIEAYKEAIRIKPDYADAYFYLGLNFAFLHQYSEAIEAYKETIRIKPGNYEAYYFIGGFMENSVSTMKQ